MRSRFFLSLLPLLMLAACATTPEMAENKGFTAYYKQLKATLSPIQAKLLDESFNGRIRPYGPAMQSYRNQPEETRTFESYVGPMLNANRVSTARQKLSENLGLLKQIQNETGVPPEAVVALWGIETSFGKVQGTHPVLPALTTLAWHSERHEFYDKQLRAALKLIEINHLSPTLTGSWAGAVGQPQFMPTTYLQYGQDGDHDGNVDLWHSLPDVFASTAYLLQQNGWQANTPWRLKLPAGTTPPSGLKLNERGLSEPHPLSFYKPLFTQPPPGYGAYASLSFRYYQPSGEDGPAFLVGPNFNAVLKWNNSSYFAYSALMLADILAEEQN